MILEIRRFSTFLSPHWDFLYWENDFFILNQGLIPTSIPNIHTLIFQHDVMLMKKVSKHLNLETRLWNYRHACSWWRHQMETYSALLAINAGNSPATHKGRWRGSLMLSLICAQINGWVNNCEAGGSRRHRAHYDITVMLCFEWNDYQNNRGMTSWAPPAETHVVTPIIQSKTSTYFFTHTGDNVFPLLNQKCNSCLGLFCSWEIKKI